MTTAAVRTTDGAPPSRVLHFALWGVQALLGLMFAFGGSMKATQPMAVLAEKLVWPGALPELLVRFIGVSELLGAIGLVLPAATRIKPGLTPLAAAGLVTIQLLAALFHLSRGEAAVVPI